MRHILSHSLLYSRPSLLRHLNDTYPMHMACRNVEIDILAERRRLDAARDEIVEIQCLVHFCDLSESNEQWSLANKETVFSFSMLQDCTYKSQLDTDRRVQPLTALSTPQETARCSYLLVRHIHRAGILDIVANGDNVIVFQQRFWLLCGAKISA